MLDHHQMMVWIWVQLGAHDQLSITHMMGGMLKAVHGGILGRMILMP